MADEIDIRIGERLREARLSKGFSQENMGDELDVTFQQIQKYERGLNRANPRVLLTYGKMCDKPITYFFDESVVIEGRPKDKSALNYNRLFSQLNKSQRKIINQLLRMMLGEAA